LINEYFTYIYISTSLPRDYLSSSIDSRHYTKVWRILFVTKTILKKNSSGLIYLWWFIEAKGNITFRSRWSNQQHSARSYSFQSSIKTRLMPYVWQQLTHNVCEGMLTNDVITISWDFVSFITRLVFGFLIFSPFQTITSFV
jgi:hypothetical protein